MNPCGPQAPEPEVERKHQELRNILRRYNRVLVAYSGGVDSTLVLKVATETLGTEGAVGVTAKSETLTGEEFEEAGRIAGELGLNVRSIEYSELNIDGYATNPVDRCYFCKLELFGRLEEVGREVGAEAICNGDNFEDTGDFRPGMKAGAELGVISPLKEARMSKAEVRALARHLGLPNWDKPSGACLSSRVPYGESITAEKIEAIGRGEKLLRELGCAQVRLRHHGTIARIETGVEDMARLLEPKTRERLIEELKALGFLYVTLDLAGYRTGSLNEALGSAATKTAED
jgi:uncharacterized protein